MKNFMIRTTVPSITWRSYIVTAENEEEAESVFNEFMDNGIIDECDTWSEDDGIERIESIELYEED